MQRKAFGRDRRRAVLHPGRDMHVEAGVARRTRHRQPVRQKGPVLGSDVKEPPRRFRRSVRGARRICTKVSQAKVPVPRDDTPINPGRQEAREQFPNCAEIELILL